MEAATPSTHRAFGNRFGELAVQQGLVSREQMDVCLREQAQGARDGLLRPLGQILLKRQLVTTEQFLRILQLQGKNLLACGRCNRLFAIADFREGGAYMCRTCGDPLSLPPNILDRPIEEYAPPAGAPVSGPIASGVSIGKYDVLSELARGGMGIVYLAHDHQLNRYVVLKVLSHEASSETAIQRLHREAKAAARLRHPNIVTVYDVGEDLGVHYIVMEYIVGRSLDAVMRERTMLTSDFLRVLEQVARAIHYAHENGVIHRDLKPSNILMGRDNQPVITDFGLAKVDDPATFLTRSGVAAGTPLYMAPEQVRGENAQIDGRTDVYALGVILYEQLTGQPPFAASLTAADVYRRILNDDPIRPRAQRHSVDAQLETICLRCLDKEPKRRYGSALTLADDLRRVLRGEPIHARPTTLAHRVWRVMRRRPGAAAACFLALALLGVITAISITAAARASRREHARRFFDEGSAALEQARNTRLVWEHRVDSAKRAAEQFSRALAADPDYLYARLGRAAATMISGDLDASLADYREVIAREPSSGAALAGYLTVRVTQYELAFANERDIFGGAMLEGTQPPDPDPGASPVLAPIRADIVRIAQQLARLETLEGQRLYCEGVVAYVESRWQDAITAMEAAQKKGFVPLELPRLAGFCCMRISGAWQDFPAPPSHLDREMAQKALSYLRQALVTLGQDPAVFNAIGVCMYALEGDTQETRDAFDRAVALSRGHGTYLALRGIYHQGLGRHEDALRDYDAALQKGEDWTVRYNRARALSAVGRCQEAIEDLTRALKARPGLQAAYALRAMAHLSLGHEADAEADARAALAIADASATAYDVLARLRAIAGDYEGCLRLCAEARRCNATLPDIAYTEGLALAKLGRHEEAVAALTRFIDGDRMRLSTWWTAQVERARLLILLHRPREAMADLDRVLSRHPRNANARYLRGLLHYSEGRPKEALDDMEAAIAFGDLASPESRYYAGAAACQLAEWARALKHFDEAIRLRADSGEYYGARGDAHLMLGHLREALADYEKAVKLDTSLESLLKPKIEELHRRLDGE